MCTWAYEIYLNVCMCDHVEYFCMHVRSSLLLGDGTWTLQVQSWSIGLWLLQQLCGQLSDISRALRAVVRALG